MTYLPNDEFKVIEPLTAFGAVNVAEETPKIQLTFSHGINNRLATTTVTGSGTVSVTGGNFATLATTTATGTAVLISRKCLAYKAGTGLASKFTAIWSAPVLGQKSYKGIGFSTVDGFYFGYHVSSTEFGIIHRNNSVDTLIPQSTWNVDKMDGSEGLLNPSKQTLDTTKGNVFRIQMQFLGFGQITFSIENKATGKFQVVHVIQYTNTNTVTSLTNPILNLRAEIDNFATGVAMTLKTPSMSGFVEGKDVDLGVQQSEGNFKTSVTTETNIFSLRNRTTINGVTNRIPIKLMRIGGSTAQGNRTVRVRVMRGSTVGGTPVFNNIDTNNSVSAVDIAGTTITGGIQEFGELINVAGSFSIDVSGMDIYLLPGETWSFTAETTNASTVDMIATWLELW